MDIKEVGYGMKILSCINLFSDDSDASLDSIATDDVFMLSSITTINFPHSVSLIRSY
jgi:hypothetical protein